MSSYDGLSGKDYILKTSGQFPANMEFVLDFEFDEQKIYYADDLRRLSRESGIDIRGNEESFLSKVLQVEPEMLYNHGMEVDNLDEFQLQAIRVSGVNNEEREVRYEGTFFGDSSHIDPLDWAVYSRVTVQYVPNANFNNAYNEIM